MNLLPGKDEAVHRRQIAHERVEKVTDYLTEGQIIKVKVMETDEKGRIKLSMKALLTSYSVVRSGLISVCYR